MNHNMIIEVIPYSKTASEAYANKCIDKVATALDEMKNVSMINIPEIVEENHEGLPYYRNVDTRKFSEILRRKCRKDVMINTVVVHHKSKQKFEEWLDECISKYGIKNFVFVGAKIQSVKYPGPSVAEANVIASKKGVNIGNIFIPGRENETMRLLSKTESGCNFFTTQVLFESDSINNVINEYSQICENKGLKPAKIYLSFSPISSMEDIEFLKWLGVKIDHETESKLRNSRDIGLESIKIIAKIINKIFDSYARNNVKVPLGLNIEYITFHNLELSKNLANSLSKLMLPIS